MDKNYERENYRSGRNKRADIWVIGVSEVGYRVDGKEQTLQNINM